MGVLLTTSFSLSVNASENNFDDQLNIKYTFDKPSINQITINGKLYDQIIMKNTDGANNPGEPDLPSYGVNLLLPQGSEILGIDVSPGDKVLLGENFNIAPVLEPVKISEIYKGSNLVINKNLYNSENLFPGSLFTVIDIYSFRGYDILVLLLHPVQYIPQSGELYFYDHMTISVNLETNTQMNPLFRNLEKDKYQVLKKIDNPSMITTYTKPVSKPTTSEDFDLLILTTSELKNSFKPLKNAHDSNGIKTEIKTLNDIKQNPDEVTPEDVREYIRKKYRENNIEFVLIGGDSDVIPTRNLWVMAWSGGDTTNMPSDIYYACLDGCYNYDEDNRWGERNDGEDEGDVDLMSEVYVGRACVDNINDVENFVDKTLSYMDSGGYSNGQVLMVGEYLWSDPDTWGGDYMDELIDGSYHHNYKTIGIPSDEYNIDTLYDRDWIDNDWPKSEIIDRINNDVRIINHLGHSYYGYNMKMDIDDVDDLDNNNPCFVYSQGCMAGGFDNPNGYDCIAEYLTVKTKNAAFAVIMNARFGWGSVGSTNGASQRFHRQFLDAIYGEGIAEIGKANHDSKEDNLNRINAPCMRWCYYQLNLFGDPTLTFYQDDNHAPSKPDRPTGKQLGFRLQDYEFITSGTDSDGDELYYKWDWGDDTSSDWVGPYDSGEQVSINHSWKKMGFYNVKVKTRDEHLTQSIWSDSISVIMPKNTRLTNSFINVLNERFTNMIQIFRLINFLIKF